MSTIDTTLDVQIKTAHRRMWASGDYPAVAREVIPELGAVLTQALRVQPNDSVLDVAAGSGNAAIPAARVGARVTATDLAPELFDAGRRDAAIAGVKVTWLEADAERLPFDDGSFDVGMSCVGVMIGLPLEGLKMFSGAIMSIRASICASTESGTCTAI